MPAAFACDNLELGYNGTPVLIVPEFAFESGRVYALLGPNGSGKTTLLRALNGFVKPKSGRILFFGEPMQGGARALVAKRRRMSLVAQTPALFDASLLYNVAYGLRARGVRGAEAVDAARDAIARVGLSRYERTNARLLSGGEAQRAALARALAVRPQALLLDEPTSNVDAENARIIEDIIRAAGDNGTTVILSTHNPEQARRIATHAVLLRDGTITQADPADTTP